METIIKILTTEDQQELKQGIKEIIIEKFREDVNNYYSLFESCDIDDMIQESFQESFQEVIDEIKVEFKEKLREQMLRLLDTNDIEKLIGLKKKMK